MRYHTVIPIIFMLSSLLISGCATTQPQPDPNTASQQKITLDTLELADGELEQLPFRVAILPFENTTVNDQAYKIVRRTFYNHFASKRYKDIELFEIDQILKDQKIYDNNKFADQASNNLGHMLQADGLVYGKIIGYDRTFLGIYSQVSVELEVRLVNAASGQVIWKAQHKTTTHEGSVPLDPISLIPAIYRTTMKMRSIELIRTAEDLCRTIVSALPEPNTIQWQNSVGGQSLARIFHD